MAERSRFASDDPREWLVRARSSLRHAEARTEGVCLAELCYDAQQAAEKAIKAVMITRNVRFPYTHNLKKLLDRLEAAGHGVTSDLRDAAAEGSHRPAERYPFDRLNIEPDYLYALEGARRLVSWAEGEVAGWRGGTGRVREPPLPVYADHARHGGAGSPDPALLAEVVERIVLVASPERIILFGSAARGTMRAHSDLDVMVVKSVPFEYNELTDALDDAVYDLPVDVDVLLATPEQLERYGRSWCLVYCPALEEGRVIYEQARGFMAGAGSAPTA